MKNTKIFSALTAFIVAILGVSSVFASGEYLPDVENVVATPVVGGIQLAWDSVAGANQYTLYYGRTSINPDGASYEKSILLVIVTNYLLTGLTPETKYYIAVAADDSTGSRLGSFNYSEEVSVTTLSEQPVAVEPTPAIVEPTPPAVIEPIPAVDPLASITTQSEITAIPTLETTESITEISAPVEDLVGQKFNASGEVEPSTAPEDLPKSGPELALVFLVSGAGTYLWRKYRK
jgi:hypothetical protein